MPGEKQGHDSAALRQGNQMFTTEELALLEAIHADPRNDAPRMAYADWLEKANRPEYAEFIRLQCQQPYIGVVYHPPSPPHVSHSFEMAWGDPQAEARLKRLLTLAPHAYRLGKEFWEEHFRGLPLLQEELYDGQSGYSEELVALIGPAARLDLSLHTSRLVEWLAHPAMARVDKLHIWPELPPDAERDEQCTMNPHYDAFWAENIPVLAASTVIDRLEELNPCGCHSTGELTSRSVQNLALCKELLEPRVSVEYSY
jgi:uncharacterized protein (TIGR02996 family)